MINDIRMRYLNQDKTVQWQIVPSENPHPEAIIPGFSLAQIAVRGKTVGNGFSAGKTMREHAPTNQFRMESQNFEHTEHFARVITRLAEPDGLAIENSVTGYAGDTGLLVSTAVHNRADRPFDIEMLSSFCLSGITPYADDDTPNRLRLHRFRSAWSGEGRHDAADIEDLHLERTWGDAPVSLRYGQAGSLPVREFFPFIAIEDTETKTFWGAMLAWHGSWQMECFRTGDQLSFSGGLGDFESAHWMKTLQPGESFTAPTALVTTCCGTIDDVCSRLVALQHRLAHPEPACEKNLPPIFNEWCSSWGKPTENAVLHTADILQATRTRCYLVIDDGWAERPPEFTMQYNGDWDVSAAAFPNGLRKVCEQVRKKGLTPGIWFEFEPCTTGTKAFDLTDHQLTRHGHVITVGNRHFWDFRDPWTFEYLQKKVINLLRENGFGYLKVDYNECIGIGCDGAESLGEGLRQHLEKVQEFFQLIRRELPELVIENCASGGHRLEPGMVGLTSMSSFSDSHEAPEIPILAANMHRLIPPHKNQIWAVLRTDHPLEKMHYVLSSTFLGRMCISGDLSELSPKQLDVLKEAQAFYEQATDIIRNGTTRIVRDIGKSYRHPAGQQTVVRHFGTQCLIVYHSFAALPENPPLPVPLPEGNWSITAAFGTAELCISEATAQVRPPFRAFQGSAWILSQKGVYS